MILVIGAGGFLGGAVFRALRDSGIEAAGTTLSGTGGFLPLDLADLDHFDLPPQTRVALLFTGPGGLDACAVDPATTRALHVDATTCLAKTLAHRGVPVVFPSTNLVFEDCEYGAQKAAVESALHNGNSAIVRITKIVESLRPRFLAWAETLRCGDKIHASPVLRFAPLALDEAVRPFLALAKNFQPGVFQFPPDRSFSYFEAARLLAEKLGRSPELVEPDQAAGLHLFKNPPRYLPMEPIFPRDATVWHSSPASEVLDRFLARIAAQQN
jgi:dTDP-4-dehydrorhamnose reductase